MLRHPVVGGGSRHAVGSARKDQKYFSKTGGMSHNVNLRRIPMRGGYRL